MPDPTIRHALYSAAIVLAACGSGGSAQQPSALPYVDVTATHVPQAPTLHALDVALVDVDRDRDFDVILAVEYGANRLYLNDGTGSLTWKQGALGTERHDSEHVRTADFNRDGFADLLFVAEDDEVHQLFFGDGKGGFADVSDRLPRRSQGNGLAVGDVDRDGLADIVVGNSSESGRGQPKPPARNFLWLNDKARPGHFRDVTETHLPANHEDTQGIALADMDGDGDLDMAVANQTPPNRLLLNDGQGRFRDASDRLELKVPLETREVHVLDANGDRKPDLLFLNLTSNARRWEKDPQARLLVNDGKGRFRDETASRLPAHRFSSWGGLVVDFNRDGAPDIVVGAIEVPGFKPLQLQAWRNDGSGHFRDVTAAVIPATAVGRSWSMAKGDLNGDGRDDLFIGQWGTQARLLLATK